MNITQGKDSIYLDHSATTPVDPHVVTAMLPYWSQTFGNPSSLHSTGAAARRAVDRSRRMIANELGAPVETILFTGCGSESNNLALRGVMLAARSAGRGNHLITSVIEHNAVLKTAEQLRDEFGFDLTILPVDKSGRLHINNVERAIRPDTVLISIMAASNEIGTIQPWREIGELARKQNILFHTDAVQLAAARHWNLSEDPIDLMTLAPHKFYGPKGIGILYVRDRSALLPTLTGGSHEHGLRAGTTNVPLVVGAAEALHLALENIGQKMDHYKRLRDRLLQEIPAELPGECVITGHFQDRLPHHASFAFRGLDANALLMHLDMAGIAAGSGSACGSGDSKPSAVLEAMGLSSEWTHGGLRLTVGLQNSDDDINSAVNQVVRIARRLASLEQGLMTSQL